MSQTVPLASNGLTTRQIEDAISVLKSGNLTMGENVKNFESTMASYLGVSDFVMVNSGSSANLAMIEFLLRPTRGAPLLRPGDEVLVPAIAWPTTIWPLLQLGLVPRFVDINEEDLSLDLSQAQQVVDENRNVKALLPIHPLGFAMSSSQLSKFAEENRLVLINDVCESLGSFSDGQHAGTGGIAGSFSFYFSHHITTMEGGGVATDSHEMADDLRSIRSHGWSRDRSDRASWHQGVSETDSRFTFVSTGYNIRPMEVQAAIGLSEVEKIDGYVERRRQVARHVEQSLDGTGLRVIGARHVKGEGEESHSWMHIPIRVDATKLNRDKILDDLDSMGIETRPILTGNFLHQPSAKRFLADQTSPESFPRAEEVSSESFLVGCHHSLTDSQVAYLAESLAKAASSLGK